jgi:hypothetical protein
MFMAGITALAPAACLAAEPGLNLRCEVFYTPARKVWTRELEIEHDAHRILALRIDGLPPYSFSVHGQQVSTALDNEQIQIDLAEGLWRSDFRGLASGEGRCAPKP